MVHIKSSNDIEKMQIAGKLASEVLEMIEPHVVAGISTEELNSICHKFIIENQNSRNLFF